MSPIVDVTAILIANPGKIERVVDEFRKMEVYVKANEPQVLRYELRRGLPEKNNGVELVVIREIYANEEVQRAHIATPQCQAFMKAMEEEKLCSEVKVVVTKPGGPGLGFEARL
ncbi:hypothetical protein QBC33DRAFT_134181 [Phialemonium atrogriseum]|uniref:ABM domain-containing protein n=1 Tax=Phialemonium atrogriseum TaxID=1093897 RepID=A0AAJ0FKN0_9PEZI|nr:uncharacterized protein QBC33DRAFT_134181 [Phialemonium atrogriseum]KAK1765749.1 hypothetical protein QBC33DRAFT_134181 [Phialemonium atrogriseum]